VTLSSNGIPVQHSSMIVDGIAMPPLPDWEITSFSWQVDGGAPAQLPVPDCNASSMSPPGCASVGGSVEISAAIPPSALSGLGSGIHHVTVTATETKGGNPLVSNPVTLDFTYVNPTEIAHLATTTIDKVTPSVAGPSSDNTSNLNYWGMIRVAGSITDNLNLMVTGGEMVFAPVCPTAPLTGPYVNHYKGQVCTGGSPIGIADPSKPTADGTGIEITPDGGIWNNVPGTPVNWSVQIPSVEFDGFPQGLIEVFVHSKDQTGQWGPWTSKTVLLDKTPPTATGNVTNDGGGKFTLHIVNAHDPLGPSMACTDPNNSLPSGCGGPGVASGVVGIDFYSSAAQEAPEGAGQFSFVLPDNQVVHGNGNVSFNVPLVGFAPAELATGDIWFRVRDVAGNQSDWINATGPA
jgi:hypothetical protein